MLRLIDLGDRVLRVVAALALGVTGAVMFMQIVARYVFDAPFAWADEFVTLLFSWIIFLGAAAVQRSDSHLSVDTLRAHLGPSAQAVLDVIRRVVIIACCVVLVWQGIALSAKMWPLEYPAMEVTRSLLYMTVPISGAFMAVFALRSLLLREPPAQGDPIADETGDAP